MAARKRFAFSRTIAVSRMRKGRLYFCLAASRTSSKSRLTSGCVSKSCSCGCWRTTFCLLRAKLLRSPIDSLQSESELSFRNVPDDHVVNGAGVLLASHDDLLLLAEYKRKKT